VAEAGEAVARAHLRRQIADPVLRAKLTPDYRLGCKRVLISNDYYPALSRDNTEVVTDPIAEIRARSVVTADGVVHPADIIIYGTGFHTTDSFAAVRIVGQNGLELTTAFADGMHAYWGMAVPRFPNLFLLLGPNTGLGHNSVVLMIEAQMRYVLSLLSQMKRRGWTTVDVKPEVEAAWNRTVQDKIGKTVWITGGCTSWYLDANGRNTTIWPGFVAEYQMKTRRANIADYARVA
jgi:cation diffusion facilitator CzcD-associated flavoprotein CzcO